MAQHGDITMNFHGGNQLSIDAYLSVRENNKALRAQIVRHISALGTRGATSDEVEQDLELPHQTVSARLTEAKAAGQLKSSGEKRKTRSGRNAAVLVAV